MVVPSAVGPGRVRATRRAAGVRGVFRTRDSAGGDRHGQFAGPRRRHQGRGMLPDETCATCGSRSWRRRSERDGSRDLQPGPAAADQGDLPGAGIPRPVPRGGRADHAWGATRTRRTSRPSAMPRSSPRRAARATRSTCGSTRGSGCRPRCPTLPDSARARTRPPRRPAAHVATPEATSVQAPPSNPTMGPPSAVPSGVESITTALRAARTAGRLCVGVAAWNRA